MSEIDVFEDDVKGAALDAAAEYGWKVGIGDVEQEIWLDLYRNPGRYERIGGKLRRKVMVRAGKRYCLKELLAYEVLGAQETYSREEVKGFLPVFYDRSLYPIGLPEQPAIGKDGCETAGDLAELIEPWHEAWTLAIGRLFISLLDIDYAVSMITESQRKVIEKKYRDRERLTSGYQKNKHAEAINWITCHANHSRARRAAGQEPHDGPGARRAISNHEAIRRTHSQAA